METAHTATGAERASASSSFDVERVRRDFPILHQEARGKPLVYLDNAATSQKPRAVIDAVREYYERDNANVHRGVHLLSERATRAFEAARGSVQRLLGAADGREIVFCRGTTEAVNLVAQTFGRSEIGAGDEIVLTVMEHHSNIVPWQLLAAEVGATIRVVDINERGELDYDQYESLLGDRTKLVGVVHVSNSLGTINPVKRMIEAAHERGACVLVDGAQAASHLAIDVRDLDCDFYAVSAHKAFGPTGFGALYGKAKLLEAMPPYQGGGEMISQVSFEGTTYNRIPHKFEAGTPHIAGAVGFAAAIEYVEKIGYAAIEAHENALLEYGTAALSAIPGIRLIGTAEKKASVLSFVVEDVHAHDVGTIIDQQGIAVRAGHHCTQPLMDRLGLSATVRASLAFYNTKAEIDALVRGLETVREIFG